MFRSVPGRLRRNGGDMGLSSSFGGAEMGQIGAFHGASDLFNGLLDLHLEQLAQVPLDPLQILACQVRVLDEVFGFGVGLLGQAKEFGAVTTQGLAENETLAAKQQQGEEEAEPHLLVTPERRRGPGFGLFRLIGAFSFRSLMDGIVMDGIVPGHGRPALLARGVVLRRGSRQRRRRRIGLGAALDGLLLQVPLQLREELPQKLDVESAANPPVPRLRAARLPVREGRLGIDRPLLPTDRTDFPAQKGLLRENDRRSRPADPALGCVD